MDRIFIRDLALRCIIGVQDFERKEKQDVLINLELEADLSTPGASDDIGDTVDYKTLKKRIIALVEDSRFKLVEALAEAIARTALEDPKVERVKVLVEKPGALRFARSVGVEVERVRNGR
jgi:FolB domain-containing protein